MKSINDITAPSPMISKNKPADWIFMFKFNTHSFPKGDRGKDPTGIFGGKFRTYRGRYSQQYVYASSENPKLKKGKGAIGTSLSDPLGATFAQIYHGDYNYVVWNDQFYDAPIRTKSGPWGHSKGALAWNDEGEGMVLQVSTPSWPGSGNHLYPRLKDGNTLGTVEDDDIEVSQHFFALKLSRKDVINVLKAIQNASIVTKRSNKQLVKNGGPAEIQALVKTLGKKSDSTHCSVAKLSNGVKLVSKPSLLHVPPWQLVSAKIGSIPLRVASWWKYPSIYSTSASSHISCWANRLGNPGNIEIATSGSWKGVPFSLKGGSGYNFNHAKIGVSLNPKKPISIFGDMNQQGAISPSAAYSNQRCSSSQNGRGGIFYVLENEELYKSVFELLKGDSASTLRPVKKKKKSSKKKKE